MKAKKLQIFLVSILLAFLATMLVFMNASTPKASADQSTATVFQMNDGGTSVKINADGGIRWKVKMDQLTKENIVDNDDSETVSLKFIITTEEYFNRVTDDTYYETLSVEGRAHILTIDEETIYEKDGLYWANACLINFTKDYDVNYVALAVIDFGNNTYQYATVNGKAVSDADFSINWAKANLYGLLNRAVLDTNADYATGIMASEAYAWFGSENYPINVSELEEYEWLITNVNKGIDYGTKQIKIAETVNTAGSSVELGEGKELPQNSYSLHTVNFYLNNGDETPLYTATVKNYGEGAEAEFVGDEPAKESTAETTYTFAGWVKADGSEVKLDKIDESISVYANFTESVREYTITWLNDDGSVISTSSALYGYTPVYDGENPATTIDSFDVYEFTGWTPAITAVDGDATYTATYTKKARYEVSQLNDNWYDDTTITYTTNPADLTDGASGGYVVDAPNMKSRLDIKYMVNANFKVGKTYKITVAVKALKISNWYDVLLGMGTDLEETGKSIDCWGNALYTKTDYITMDKDATGYSFGLGLKNDGATTALKYSISIFVAELDNYTVTWVNEDGTVLETDENVEVLSVPTYNGATPTKAPENGNVYKFDGWSPAITELTGDITYTAKFYIPDPYEAEQTANWITNTTITYTEDTAKLPSGATSGYIVNIPSFNKSILDIKNTLNGTFKVGTYAITIDIKVLSIDDWYDIKWNLTGAMDYITNNSNISQYAKTYTHTENINLSEPSSSISFLFELYRSGGTNKPVEFAISVTVSEVRPYQVTKTSSWKEGTTITYTEDTAILPTGATNGYIIEVPATATGETAPAVIQILNTLNGTFKANTTYAVTIKVKAISASPWYDIKWDLNGSMRYITNNSSISTGTNYIHTENITVAEDTSSINFNFKTENSNRPGNTIKYAISVSVEEVVA